MRKANTACCQSMHHTSWTICRSAHNTVIPFLTYHTSVNYKRSSFPTEMAQAVNYKRKLCKLWFKARRNFTNVTFHDIPNTDLLSLLTRSHTSSEVICFLFWQSAVRTVRWWCCRTPTPRRMPSQIPPAHRTAITSLPPGKLVHHRQKAQHLWRKGSLHRSTQVYNNTNNNNDGHSVKWLKYCHNFLQHC